MSKYTSGKFLTDGQIKGMPWTVHVNQKWDDLGPSNGKVATAEDIDGDMDTRIANAKLICEAFNVAHETGRTPRQLAEERGKLLAALKAEVADLLDRNRGSTHWVGCEAEHPKCAALMRMQAAIADAEGGAI